VAGLPEGHEPKEGVALKVLWCHVAGSPSLITPGVYSRATRSATDTPNLSASAACQRPAQHRRREKGTLLSFQPQRPQLRLPHIASFSGHWPGSALLTDSALCSTYSTVLYCISLNS